MIAKRNLINISSVIRSFSLSIFLVIYLSVAINKEEKQISIRSFYYLFHLFNGYSWRWHFIYFLYLFYAFGILLEATSKQIMLDLIKEIINRYVWKLLESATQYQEPNNKKPLSAWGSTQFNPLFTHQVKLLLKINFTVESFRDMFWLWRWFKFIPAIFSFVSCSMNSPVPFPILMKTFWFN